MPHFYRDFMNLIGSPAKILDIVIVPRFRESAGTLNLIRLPVRPSVRSSVTKTLTLAITFALLQLEL